LVSVAQSIKFFIFTSLMVAIVAKYLLLIYGKLFKNYLQTS